MMIMTKPFGGVEDNGYALSDYDGTDPLYIGNLSSSGKWIIEKYTNKTMRYCMGYSGYSANWSSRESLIYSLYNEG